MNNEYYLITYLWKSKGAELHTMTVWNGSIADWFLSTMEYEESYYLINASKISKEEFDKLDGEL